MEFEPEPENFEKNGSFAEAGSGAASCVELEIIKSQVEAQVARATESGRKQAQEELNEAENNLEKQTSKTLSENLNKMIPEGTEVTPEAINAAMETLNKFAESFNDPNLAQRLTDLVKDSVNNAEALNKMQTMTEGFAKKIGEIMDESKSLSEEYENKIKDLEEKVKTLKDKIDNQKELTDNDLEELKDAANKAVKTAKKSKAAEDAEAEAGKRGGEKIMSMDVLRALMSIGGLFGFFFGLSWLADSMTGCYKYTGDDGGVKIDDILGCKKKPDATKCNCGNAKPDTNTIDKLQELCKSSEQKGYPWCCGDVNGTTPSGLNIPTCGGGTPGDDRVVYYAFHKYTPAVILAGLPNTIVETAKGLGNAGTAIFNQIIKWIGLALIILVGIAILYFIGQFILHKMTAPKTGFKTY